MQIQEFTFRSTLCKFWSFSIKTQILYSSWGTLSERFLFKAGKIQKYFSKILVWFLGMSCVIQTKYLKSLLTSIAIFHCRKMLTWAWQSIIVKCLFLLVSYCSLSQFICSIFFSLFFSKSFKDKVNLEFLLTIKEHK